MPRCTECSREHNSKYQRCDDCRVKIRDRQNALRAERAKKGLCKCGEPVEAGKSHCRECLDYYSARKAVIEEERRLDGLCPRCGKPAKEGNVLCEWHLALLRAYADIHPRKRARKRGYKPDPKMQARVSACKARWKAQGRCIVCGKDTEINKYTGNRYVKCKKHRLMDGKRAAARRKVATTDH